MVVVPRIERFEGGTALELLFDSSVRLATVVQAASRRRDVRELRARLVLLLLRLRCPPGRAPAKTWYVPGGVARLGISGVVRAWRGFFGGEVPTERTLRAHLGVLEKACAVIRAPGDWIPTPAGAPRLRHPDTFHLLDDERDARWWADEGLPLLDRNAGARNNPTDWRRLFRGWRDRARDPQARLPFPAPDSRPDQDARPASSNAEDARVVRAALETGEPFTILSALRAVGADPDPRVLIQLAADRAALARAAARLAGELERRTRIRNRRGWIVWAFREAGGRLGFPSRSTRRPGA